MLSAEKPLTLIHGTALARFLLPSEHCKLICYICTFLPILLSGPPGTGKTVAITAAVAASITSTEHHFYVLTCQTNAATRNLAATLLKRGVSDFKIVVSDDFFVEWHEDKYKKISDHVILSSNTKTDGFGDAIGPRTVVLCSVSQLSNANIISVLKRRRLTHLVIDEASQICIANLPHILTLYQDSLKRLTFVGDPKQLAPFGNEQHPTVQSVYERLGSDVMLNNPREADAVVQIIFNQFLHREFLVITPYNAQKELIANRLRDAIAKRRAQGKRDIELSVADERVHTVDTVQGQEADIIVFSAVRTIQPGCLSNKRRMNVALTRAKEHLVVLAHMALFRTGHGKKSLLGVFVREMEKVTHMVSSKQLAAVAGYQLEFHPKQKRASITTTPTTIASTGDAENIKGKNWKQNRRRNLRRKEKKRQQKADAKSRGSGTDLAR
ncbi:P-loop containing nucleoside triphosphate hydrolase protein [Geranomyces variabilis]|nr:P-loop containing nucleoside triphosphate hydrolase protein [Geranomyces variabilis]